MKTPKPKRVALIVLLTVVAFQWGCERVSVVGRPTLEPGAGRDEVELTAQFDGVDTRHQEMYLRTGDGQSRIVRYTADARAVIGGQEYPVTQLRRGDTVVV